MIDSHSHIYTPRFDNDRPEVLERARAAGITQLLQVGCNLQESQTVVAFSEEVPGVYGSVGVHPHDADTVDDGVMAGLETLTRHPKVLAWGEIGLDFYYDNSPRQNQMEAFERQLTKAVELGLPVVIHTRDAEPETRSILEKIPVERGGQVHCFTGSASLAASLLDMGYHIGFTGIITFKNAADLRDVVKLVPMDRLLIETDSPYLAPVPHRGKRNEPAFVSHVAATVATIKGLTAQEVITQTSENFKRLYGKPNMTWEPLA